MSQCNISNEDYFWPEDDDISGDNMFLFENNSLLDSIRKLKKSNQETDDLFLENLNLNDDEDEEEPIMTVGGNFSEEKPYNENLEKVKYILKKLEQYQNNN
jgi:hypothetical protein